MKSKCPVMTASVPIKVRTVSRAARILTAAALLSICLSATRTSHAAWPGPSSERDSIFSFYQPNLTLMSLDIDKNLNAEGQPIFTFKIKNTGNTMIGSFKYKVRAHANGALILDRTMHFNSIILPGETRHFAFLPSLHPQIPVSAKTIYAFNVDVNYDMSPHETTYSDNYYWHYEYI